MTDRLARLPLAPAAAFSAAATLVLAGCGGAPSATLVERVDSAGIEIVMNRGEDRPAGWMFEREFSLGGSDEGPESFFNVSAGAVATGRDGHLYVLDRGNHRVVVFDGEGRHVRTFGRQGGGPGELQWPQSIVVAQDGSLAIADIGHRGLVRVSPDGQPLENRMLEGWVGGGMAAFGDGLIAQLNAGEMPDLQHQLTYLGDEETRPLVTMPSPPLRPVDFGCVRISGMSGLFAPSLLWAASADRLAAVTTPAYEIDLYDGDRMVGRLRRDVPLRPATRELAIQEVGEKFEVQFGGGGSCVAEPPKVVDERGFAEWIPAIRRIRIAPDGTFWVQRFAVKGDAAATDLFSADGVYLGTLPDDAPYPVAFFPDGRIITVEKDDLDLDHVVVYHIAS